MRLQPSDKTSADTRLWCGFALFATWFVLLPRTAVSNSTVIQGNALVLGYSFVALFAALAAIGQALEGRGKRALAVMGPIAAAGGGIAFLALTNTEARLACFVVETGAGIALLLQWGRLLSARPLEHVFAAAVCALGALALFHFALEAVGAAAGMLGNSHAFSDLVLAALVPLPLVSGALAWMEGEPDGGQGPASDCRSGVRPGPNAVEKGEADGPVPLSYAIILCLASVLASFACGFTFLPHYLDWNLAAGLRSGIVLAAAVAAALYLRRRPVLTLSHANPFLLFSLLAAIAGFLLLTVNAPAASLAARSLLDAARDCYFVIAFVLLCGLVRMYRLAFLPAFALGMLGTGLYWAYDLGVFAKRLLGYDLQILAPLSAACIAVLAAAFFLLFVRGPGGAAALRDPEAPQRAGTPTEPFPALALNGAAASRGPVSKVAPKVQGGKSVKSEAPPEEPPLDAASARQIIEKTHGEVLAPYQLSPRELQVSLLMLDGFTAAAASEKLGISIATVKFHLGNAYRKIGIQSKSELVQLAKRGEAPSSETSPEGEAHAG